MRQGWSQVDRACLPASKSRLTGWQATAEQKSSLYSGKASRSFSMGSGALGTHPAKTEAPAAKDEAQQDPPAAVAKELIMPFFCAMTSYWSFAMLFVIGHIRARHPRLSFTYSADHKYVSGLTSGIS